MATLKEEINTIRNEYKSGTSYEKLALKYSVFKEQKPHLFDMICSDKCDDNMLGFIIKQYTSVQDGNQTQHDASVRVGSLLVDTYVKPNLN
jgi:archaellum component FlaC